MRPRRWLHVPKAALVTVLGLALSAWLIPAMTKQWDDRQRERELKAGVVADMASATSRALVGGEAMWSVRRAAQRPREQERQRLASQWALSALGIEARLRTYFSPSVVTSWEVYSWAVTRFIDGDNVSAGSAALERAVESGVQLDATVADAVALLLWQARRAEPPAPTFAVDPSSNTRRSDSRTIPKLEKMLSPQIERDEATLPHEHATWTKLEKRLLAFEQTVSDQVLGGRAAGFSTTTGDLLDDLLP
jgi:hypothetical protein